MPVTEIQKGYHSYLIAGPQVSWGLVCAPGNMKPMIYEFVSADLQNQGDSIEAARFQGNPSPTKLIEAPIHVEGNINMHLHSDDMLFWMAHLLMLESGDVTSTDFTAQEVYGDGGGSHKAVGAATLSLDTQPAATTTPSDPGKLIFLWDGVETLDIVITGTDQNNQAITETLVFSADATKTTTKWFQTVDASGVKFYDTGTTTPQTPTPDLLITCDKDTYTHVIDAGIGDQVTEGFTVELVEGEIPSTVVGCLINNATIDIGEVVTLSMSIMGKEKHSRFNVDDVYQGNPASETPTSVAAYSRVTDQVFPAWGSALEIDGVQIPVKGVPFAFNNNLQQPIRRRAVRSGVKLVRGSNRLLEVTPEIDYNALGITTNKDFDVVFNFDEQVSAKVYFIRKPYEGAEYIFELYFPRCELVRPPARAVDDYSEVMQTLALRPIRPIGATYSDEIQLNIISPEDGTNIFP